MRSGFNKVRELFSLLIDYCVGRATASLKDDKCSEAQANAVVDWLYVAASLAWCMNPGYLRSFKIEQIIRKIGLCTLGEVKLDARPPKPVYTHVVHVATAVSLRGGHTRVIARWINNCRMFGHDQVHHLVLTGQGTSEIPGWLEDAVQKTGGECFLLDRKSGWIGCAKALREYVVRRADAVVLHVHPNDPIVNLAFGELKNHFPIFMFNHADHVFSLGMGGASRVLDFRKSGQDLTLRYRNVNSTVVPLPLIVDDVAAQNRSAVRLDARKRLNISGDTLVALTIGDEYKYKDALGYSFIGCVSDLLKLEPELILVVVGIPMRNEWAALAAEYQNRFFPVGTVTDRSLLNDYYSAADVYLEGFPFSSLTAMIDAGLNSLPIQRMLNVQLPILSGDDIALDGLIAVATNCGEYISGVSHLLGMESGERANLGQAIRSSIIRSHCGEMWFKTFVSPLFNSGITNPCEGCSDELNEIPDFNEQNDTELDALAEFQFKTRGAFVVTLISMAQSPLSLLRLQKILLDFLFRNVWRFSLTSVVYSLFMPLLLNFLRYVPRKKIIRAVQKLR